MKLFQPKYKDGDRLSLKDGQTLRLSVNKRARRISIRIDAREREAVVVAPSAATLSQGVTFALQKADWIAQKLDSAVEVQPFRTGMTVGYLGQTLRLEAVAGVSAARLYETDDGPVLRAGGEGEAFSRRIENWFRRQARAFLLERTEHYLQKLGQGPVRVSIVDTRSRWGSCSPHNRSIRYSWRVVMAPRSVADYLAAHEVAHLVRADHSPQYWAVVTGLIGDHKPMRHWLKVHGAQLHAIGN
ncbi:SprT family zinc-dependent metalloprotease [Brevundimonas sp.]|uniref:M48 family metallopeptidase n=2 Tax=Brevundimonas sp. TaxID=1871086 RepID=UPI002FC69C8F